MLKKGEHVLSTQQFDKEAVLDILQLARELERRFDEGENLDFLRGKVLATLFFEPSTRTRSSFEVAMLRLGGSVVSSPDMKNLSSVKKRETLADTGKVVSQLADVIAMRHPQAHAVEELASKSDVPVLNGGDGPNQHPTQGLLDMYTIWKAKGGFDGLVIGMGGDLKFSRVLRSQCELLRHFGVAKFIFVSPPGLAMKDDIVEDLRAMGHTIEASEDYESVIGEMDVINCSRIQEERFDSAEEYEKYAGVYVLDGDLMAKVKADAIVMHPLPRVDEIKMEVDDDPRAKYFEQVRNGMFVRMALLMKVMGVEV